APARAPSAPASAPGQAAAPAASAPAPAPAAPSPAAVAAAVQADAAGVVYERSRLNTDLTFDNFVTGKANQLARAAALQVAENPGSSYNPPFLQGGCGLVTNHMIHAIGHAQVAAGPGTLCRF